MDVNWRLFEAINGLAGKWMPLDNIMIAFSTFVPILFMISLAGFYALGVIKKNELMRSATVNILILTIINLFISYVIGIIYFVPRPFRNSKVHLLFDHIPDASFPSDHAVGTMSIAIGIYGINKFLGKLLIIMSCIVGISRVYVGHHYPFDILGGYLIVILMSALYKKFIRDKISHLYLILEKKIYMNIISLK